MLGAQYDSTRDETLRAYEKIRNIAGSENIFSTLNFMLQDKTQENLTERQKEILKDYDYFVQRLGFDGIAWDGKATYFIKEGRAYEITNKSWETFKNTIYDNKNAILGSVLGEIALDAFTKGKGSKLVRAAYRVAGGTMGGTLGAAADYIQTNAELGRESDGEEAFKFIAQEAIIGGAAGIAAEGLAHLPWSNIFKGIKGVGEKITEAMPTTRILSGNAKRVEKEAVNANFTQEQKDTIKEAAETLGSTATFKSDTKIMDKVKEKFGENSYIYKGANAIYETLTLQKNRNFQSELIQLARADESGTLRGFLAEVANTSPKARQTLVNILNQTSAKLSDTLSAQGISDHTIKGIYDELQKTQWNPLITLSICT